MPVVSTGKGVEGLDARPGRHYLPAESVGAFVEGLTTLLDDPLRAKALVRDAGELVCSRYSLEAASARMLAALEAGTNRKSLT